MESMLFIFGFLLLALDAVYVFFIRKNKFSSDRIFALSSGAFGAMAGVFLIFILKSFIVKDDQNQLTSIYAAIGAAAGFLTGVIASLYLLKKNKNPSDRTAAVSRVVMWQKEWLDTGWTAVLLASFIMYFVAQAFRIPSSSMRDTFMEGDHLFVNKFIYGIRVPFTDGKRILSFKKPQRGDIVVFEAPPAALSEIEREKGIKKDFIKRCVAVGGDRVEIKDKVLYVNGVPQDEPYVRFADGKTGIYPSYMRRFIGSGDEYQRAWERGDFYDDHIGSRDNFGPVIVPAGHYFMLGDNRDRSHDSRFWGPLADKYVKGSSLLIYWPPRRIKFITH